MGLIVFGVVFFLAAFGAIRTGVFPRSLSFGKAVRRDEDPQFFWAIVYAWLGLGALFIVLGFIYHK